MVIGSNVLHQYLSILLFVLYALNKAESNHLCQDDEPCQGRGGCFIIAGTTEPSFLSTKCVCTGGYSGRWCQFDGKKFYYLVKIFVGVDKYCYIAYTRITFQCLMLSIFSKIFWQF